MGADPYQSESYQVIDETYFKDDYENETTSVNIMDGEDSKSLTITKKLESTENPEPDAIQLKGNKTIKPLNPV